MAPSTPRPRTPHLKSIFDSSGIKQAGYGLRDFDPSAVQAVEVMLQTSVESNMCLAETTRAVMGAFDAVRGNIARKGKDSDVVRPFHNLAVFGPAVLQPDSKNFAVQPIVNGFVSLSHVGDFLLDATDEERQQAIALATVTSRIREPFINKVNQIRISSYRLSAFVLSRPDDALVIAQIINERRTDDVALIREVLDHGHQALSSGVI